jgi:plasmid stabilization system protein ParE
MRLRYSSLALKELDATERPGVRRVPLVRYPYLIFYKVLGDEVIVLRVVHGARKEPWENL